MERTIPKFMTEKKGIFRFLVFTLFWVVIFSLIYHPNVTIRGLELKEHQYVYYLITLIFAGFLLLLVSRCVFYRISKTRNLQMKYLHLWIVMEIIVISVVLSLISLNINTPNSRPYWSTILPRTFVSVVSLLCIPYSLSWLYFSLEEQKKLLKETKEKKQFNIGKNIVQFYDEKGTFRFSVRIDDLLYIQSADNYVLIYYLNNKQEIVKYLLRNTLKRIEEGFPEHELVRCHRFYVVNFAKVRVMRKGKDGLILELDTIQPTEIPVSKNYARNIAGMFTL